jgi:hypothetical protein
MQPLHQCIYSGLFVLYCDFFNVAVGGFVAMVEEVFTVSIFQLFQLSIFANAA